MYIAALGMMVYSVLLILDAFEILTLEVGMFTGLLYLLFFLVLSVEVVVESKKKKYGMGEIAELALAAIALLLGIATVFNYVAIIDLLAGFKGVLSIAWFATLAYELFINTT